MLLPMVSAVIPVESEMKKAVEFAVAAPYPGIAEVEQDVYA